MNSTPLRAVLLLVAVLAGRAEDSLDLAGEWRLRLDPADQGVAANWAIQPIDRPPHIDLPNTTDLAGYGFALDTNTLLHTAPFPVTTRFPGVKDPVRADEHGYLVRRHFFVGPAWYEREVVVPQSWLNRTVELRLERALWRTDVWLDGQWRGSSDSLVAEHGCDLGFVAPGRHRLTIRVDNRMIYNLSTITHAYGPETQTRWNGLIGALRLEASPRLAIQSLRVFPAADRRSVRIQTRVSNATGRDLSGPLTVRLFPDDGAAKLAQTNLALRWSPGSHTEEVTLTLAEPAQAWDEFHPVRYRVQATLSHRRDAPQEVEARFGFRHVERSGQKILLNGLPIFLRGTLDCAVYPRTGHPPMTVSEWLRVLGVVKEYGFNHVRFHTWCPPDAAFEAADQLGIYLQPEGPAWVDDWGLTTVTQPPAIGRDALITDFFRAELRRMSEAYGNHPSFLLCAIGNEFGMKGTDWDRVNAMVEEIKAFDPRRLYTACGARKHLAADDYWFTHQTGASTRGVGPAHTDWDFAKAFESSPVPVIAHETGQRPVFPDYEALLPKFTGPLLPLNLERYRRGLVASGMEALTKDFVRASARFQLTQYKAEHEAMLRTAGYAGYQLLMLNDFTGQSEAHVGILDPFWESKGVVNAAEVRAWNAPTVLLARFPKFVWTAGERFNAKLEVAHFGESDLPTGRLEWSLRNREGTFVRQGETTVSAVSTRGLTSLGAISVALGEVAEPLALALTVRFAGAENRWNLWVYPAATDEPEPAGVRVTRTLDAEAIATLRAGGKVLLLAHGTRNARAARTGFESVYWSAGWWGNSFSSLGVLCDPTHPALRAFPNEGCSDWQWRDLCLDATTFDLEGAPTGYRPIVQPVPDFHYHARLAQVFEGKVENGALLVCGYDLTRDLDRRPAARQFRRSLFRYIASDAFRPTTALPLPWLEERCGVAGLRRQGARIVQVSSEDRANGNLAECVLDGDPTTFWHSRWQPQTDPMPHELIIDLGREQPLAGLVLLPRQDQANGRIREADVFASTRADVWGDRVAEVRGRGDSARETCRFPQVVTARFLRLQVKAENQGQPFAALAELDLLRADPEK